MLPQLKHALGDEGADFDFELFFPPPFLLPLPADLDRDFFIAAKSGLIPALFI